MAESPDMRLTASLSIHLIPLALSLRSRPSHSLSVSEPSGRLYCTWTEAPRNESSTEPRKPEEAVMRNSGSEQPNVPRKRKAITIEGTARGT